MTKAKLFKAVATFLFVSTVLLLILMVIYDRDFSMWSVLAAAIPSIAALIMMFDSIRNAIVDIAHKLPFIPFNKND